MARVAARAMADSVGAMVAVVTARAVVGAVVVVSVTEVRVEEERAWERAVVKDRLHSTGHSTTAPSMGHLSSPRSPS